MIIGFTERIRTVSEGAVPGVDLFQLQINVSSLRTSEREHPIKFRLQESSTTATVDTVVASSNVFDATFGSRENPDGPIEEYRDLQPGERTISHLTTAIRNDFIAENEECYTIRIFPVDVPGRRELFSCNEDSVGAESYFCEHTICIQDNDGKSQLLLLCEMINLMNTTEPFEVSFVETSYTVVESVGAVSVCVNLTRPQVDILDETVNVFVTDYSSSLYIPSGALLASKQYNAPLCVYCSLFSQPLIHQTFSVGIRCYKTLTMPNRLVLPMLLMIS